ncbi:MAG: hypothetical protein HY909_05910 [Deltaproteobacteria bacterium]|nr:hypothetical protein [Deltaproteobacteria bacterium]
MSDATATKPTVFPSAVIGDHIPVVDIRKALEEALVPRLLAAPPVSWKRRSITGTLGDEDIKRHLGHVMDGAFAKTLNEFEPSITVLFKGVTYETITHDEVFQQAIEEQFGNEQANQLLREWNTVAEQGNPPIRR